MCDVCLSALFLMYVCLPSAECLSTVYIYHVCISYSSYVCHIFAINCLLSTICCLYILPQLPVCCLCIFDNYLLSVCMQFSAYLFGICYLSTLCQLFVFLQISLYSLDLLSACYMSVWYFLCVWNYIIKVHGH